MQLEKKRKLKGIAPEVNQNKNKKDPTLTKLKSNRQLQITNNSAMDFSFLAAITFPHAVVMGLMFHSRDTNEE